MREAVGGVVLALAIFLAIPIQMFIPGVDPLFGARVILVPMLFCYGALALPTWGMLLLAMFTGLVMDLSTLHAVGGRVEIALGWSMVYFVVFGALSHGLQPAFLRGHWWIHILLAAAGTTVFLALQYVMICFRREAFVFNETVFWRIVGPGLLAAIFAPLVHLIATWGSHLVPQAGFGRPYRGGARR